MKETNIKKALGNFSDTFKHGKNQDVVKYNSEQIVSSITKSKKFSNKPVSDRKIYSDNK